MSTLTYKDSTFAQNLAGQPNTSPTPKPSVARLWSLGDGWPTRSTRTDRANADRGGAAESESKRK